MTADHARRWLIKATLLLTGATFGFLLLAPLFGYPLALKDATRVFEIILPVFLGYLGAASQFVFQNMAGRQNTGIAGASTNPFLSLIVKGPIWLFGLAIVAAFAAFGKTNSPSSPIGNGMTVDVLAGITTAALGLLNVTTQVAVSYLFSLDANPISVARQGLQIDPAEQAKNIKLLPHKAEGSEEVSR
jgi:hypothetical protein